TVESTSPQPVEIYTDTDTRSASVSAETPAEVPVLLRVQPGFHIIAADPGEVGEGLIPLRVAAVGGTGVNVYADYPEGTPLVVPGIEGAVLVHQGEVELTLALERSGERTGRPVLVLTFQACSDSECLPPQTLELDIAIDLD
ncbi:MAG: protein-disulfide reductase DsbD domain-containing protein, partial [Planctomycetota bacterium]